MIIYQVGSNQYIKKAKKDWHVYALVVGVIGFAVFCKSFGKPAVAADQLYLESIEFGKEPSMNISVETTIAGTSAVIAEPPTLENVFGYIGKVFGQSGTDAAAWAIRCFKSESGLRQVPSKNINSNGTRDWGIAQVNDIHKKRYGEKFMTDWKANIDTAYKIYLASGKVAWYGSDCK